MGKKSSWLVAASALLILAGSAAAGETSPYAGEEARSIKALSQERMRGLLAGEGLGYAKAAELNGWPGPRHVLDLKDELRLTGEQLTNMRAIFDDMNAEARQLGKELIDAEKALDQAFAGDLPAPGEINSMTQHAASIEGALRAVHLKAHLKATAVLSHHQRMTYVRARGYAAGRDHGGHSHGQ